MANPEHLKILKQGVDVWNKWREEYPEIIPNLSFVDLSSMKLRYINLINADLSQADITNADLTYASLYNAKFTLTDLSLANLTSASIYHAVFYGTKLVNTNLNNSSFGGTIIHTSLNAAIGLDTINHIIKSSISIDSIRSFKGELPENFLRGCGISDEDIAYFRSQIGKPIRFYSCFISYCTKDELFAERLHNDFQAKGIRCWKWNHDARTGQNLWDEVNQAIRKHDKLVLIASEASLNSPAVNREIERAIQQEDDRIKKQNAGEFEGDTNVLFPVTLDDFIFNTWDHHRKPDVINKMIADARGWENPEIYAKVLNKLIDDMRPTASA